MPRAVIIIAGVLVTGPFLSSPSALAVPASPQQSGAVPLTQGIADLASQLAKSVPEGHPMTIAVTDFQQRKQVCGLGQFVAERLSTLLSRQPQCRLIERHRLDQVLQELKFSMSELVDPAKAKKLGQMLGVQGLVVGTITDLGATFDVDARIIDIQTDISFPGATSSIVKDEAVRNLDSDCQGTSGPDVTSSPTGGIRTIPTESRSAPPVPQTVSVKNFTFEVKACTMHSTKVSCVLTITNDGEDANLTVYLYGANAPRIIDNAGNENAVDTAQLGNRSGSKGGSVEGSFPSGTPMTVRLTWDGVSSEATGISLLEIPFPGGRWSYSGASAGSPGGFKAQIRAIPITRKAK